MNKLRRILVVDGSRVVRATIRKHIQNDFEVIEEGNGESARQTLMLDASVEAVITGLHPPKLDACELVARMRASARCRVRELPFALIVSDIAKIPEREMDWAKAAKAFISKSMKKTEVLACVNRLLSPVVAPANQDGNPEIIGPGVKNEAIDASRDSRKTVLDIEQFQAVISTYDKFGEDRTDCCVLAFAIDNFQELTRKYGKAATEKIVSRFAGLLASKVNERDRIGFCGYGRLAIIYLGADLAHGVKIARRVCKSLASGQITIRGEKVKLTASAGVSSASDDAAANGLDLLEHAERRLDQALACGGNSVSTEFRPECPAHADRWQGFTELQNARMSCELARNIGRLGLQFIPLMRVVDKELKLGLQLEEIERKLVLRAEDEAAFS